LTGRAVEGIVGAVPEGPARMIRRLLPSLVALFGLSGPALAQEPALPGGATSLRENHGDWVVGCSIQQQSGKNVKVCGLSQEQTDQNSRQRVLAIEVRPEGAGVQGILVLPFGLALDQGASFQIDDGPASPVQKFRTCLPAGCLVPVNFDARTLAALRKGNQLKVKTVADGGKEAPFTISLKGFPGALDRTAALMK
jgi:invasion protein IalB